MTVEIQKEAETVQTFSVIVNNSSITGYSLYLADDWNSSTNANIYWKPTTQYVEPAVLATNAVETSELKLSCAKNKLQIEGTKDKSFTVELFNLQGLSVASFKNESRNEIPLRLPNGIYIATLQTNDAIDTITQKIIIY